MAVLALALLLVLGFLGGTTQSWRLAADERVTVWIACDGWVGAHPIGSTGARTLRWVDDTEVAADPRTVVPGSGYVDGTVERTGPTTGRLVLDDGRPPRPVRRAGLNGLYHVCAAPG